jgi:hypothetical protein
MDINEIVTSHPTTINGRPARIQDVAMTVKRAAIQEGLSADEASYVYVQALHAALATGFSTAKFGRS